MPPSFAFRQKPAELYLSVPLFLPRASNRKYVPLHASALLPLVQTFKFPLSLNRCETLQMNAKRIRERRKRICRNML